jgi:hypothetical protein
MVIGADAAAMVTMMDAAAGTAGAAGTGTESPLVNSIPVAAMSVVGDDHTVAIL